MSKQRRARAKGPWHCYMLRGHGVRGQNRTYVGKTNHMTRRLRQHNGFLKGGARATKHHRPHHPFIIVSGFPTQTAVLQFEWAMKHRRVRGAKGAAGRVQTLCKLLRTSRWTHTSPYTITMHLVVRTTLTRTQYLSYVSRRPNTLERALVRDTCHVCYHFNQRVQDMVKACTPPNT